MRIMREANQQFVEHEDARQSFRQEAFASWAEYQQSGQHLTGAETREWLRPWGDKEGAMPFMIHFCLARSFGRGPGLRLHLGEV